MFGLREKRFLFTVLAMAKKRNRFAEKAEQTRRINGRHVHAKKDESLRIAAQLIKQTRHKHPKLIGRGLKGFVVTTNASQMF